MRRRKVRHERVRVSTVTVWGDKSNDKNSNNNARLQSIVLQSMGADLHRKRVTFTLDTSMFDCINRRLEKHGWSLPHLVPNIQIFFLGNKTCRLTSFI